MGEIQQFTEEHAEGAAQLYLRVVRGQNRPPGRDLTEYFSYLHLQNPWAAADMPSLVYLEKGKVVGTLGVVPRTMEFRGEPIRVATMSIYMFDPEHRRGSGAVKLLRTMLSGPQELSWTDGASGHVSTLWNALGGYNGPQYAFNWIRVLRPFGMAGSGLGRLSAKLRWTRTISRLVTRPADSFLSTMPLSALRMPASPLEAREVSPDEILVCFEEIGWAAELRPFYERDSFRWLMQETAKRPRAKLRMATVFDTAGERRGWFIYWAVPGDSSWVLQVGVRSKEDFKGTLQALFRDAWQQGSVCVKGAAIPQYLTAMTELHCFFRHPYDRVVIHSRNREIVNSIRLGEAAITRLEGTSWMRFPWESWD